MPASDKTWSVKEILDWSVDYLKSRKFETPRLEAEWLLSHALGARRIDLYLQFDRPLGDGETAEYKKLLKERLKRRPLQYITGKTEFMGLPINVREGVLIPRPETEQLVEHALDLLADKGDTNPRILDIGTGSGNIAAALAHHVPGSVLTAVDKDEAALNLARENANLNKVSDRVSFLKLDVMKDPLPDERFDMVISNPPYVPSAEVSALPPEVRDWEPVGAYTDGANGLNIIMRIVATAGEVLNGDGFLVLEIGGDSQAESVRTALSEAGYVDVEIGCDYNGMSRIASGRWEGEQNE